jgi:hypothetical protein
MTARDAVGNAGKAAVAPGVPWAALCVVMLGPAAVLLALLLLRPRYWLPPAVGRLEGNSNHKSEG